MKKLKSVLISCLLLLFALKGAAQVSHGGQPLPLSSLRSSQTLVFEEMPGFDLAEQLRLDSLDGSNLRSGFRFAYKFMTDFNRGNSGTSFVLPDGTKVWRLGISSPGALSINVLFTEYELPPGARLFLYNESRTHILGSFTDENNSDLGILPVAPVDGDRLVIEYQEPARAEFPGRLTVGEVNHAYRDWRGKEPDEGKTSLDGIPALSCYATDSDLYARAGRSVVLMIIDGVTGCTGTLVNNTAGDGKPYLLTASHCLNKSFTVANPDYEKIANSIVCFYQYDSPLCRPVVRGTEELSTASAHYRAVFEWNDMALLELPEMPPAYYQPYLSGWMIDGAGRPPYFCIQHPSFSTKRISLASGELEQTTLVDPAMMFMPKAHWRVKRWDVGYTAGGSSGSALFDSQGRIVGALSGGNSTESSPVDDYFYAISQIWNQQSAQNRQLAYWLDPSGRGKTVCDGLDPYAAAPCVRLSHVAESGRKEEIVSQPYSSGSAEPLFGNNRSGNAEYAEAYDLAGSGLLYGVYLVTPPCQADAKNLDVEITVYEGDDSPYTLLYKETFRPEYRNYDAGKSKDFVQTPKPLGRSQAHFVAFAEPVRVSGRFYVGYKINRVPENAYFSVYHLPKGSVSGNTAWVNDAGTWKEASAYGAAGFATSLYLDPVIAYVSDVSNETVEPESGVLVYQDAGRQYVGIRLPESCGPEAPATYTLYAINGRLEKRGTVVGRQAVLPIGHLPGGVYLVQINYQNKEITRKIIR